MGSSEHIFACPKCGIELYKVRDQHGVFWTCSTCGGRTATLGRLRRTVPADIVNEFWQKVQNSGRKSEYACPSCARLMHSAPVSSLDGPLAVNVCPECQCAWMETGVLDKLPVVEAQPEPTDPVLPQGAKEKLALMKLDRIREEYRDVDVGSDIPEEWWKLALAIFGMPVKQDGEAREYVPYSTWGVTLLLVFTGLLSMLLPGLMLLLFGFFPVAYDRFWGLTFATSFLIHGGLVHLLGNLYFLLLFGPAVEDALGHRRVLLLLLLATVAGNVFHMLWNPTSEIPCIGASGGISGLLACYALQYPRERIGFLLCFLYYFRWVHVPAYGMFLIWVIAQALATYHQVTGFSNVSALSHVGGACTGVLFWLVMRKTCHAQRRHALPNR